MRPVGSKYLLDEVLGRGATGTVWRARQRESAGAEAAVAGQPGEVVAIKVLKEELAHDPEVVMRFLRERSVLLRLTHENIVRTRDLVVEGDLLALVMDLVDGPDLHRHLYENGPFSPVAAALVTAQIADALAAAHAADVVHRDLKPANVLLAGGTEDQPELRPMLTDFGIARLADSPGLTRTHEFVGTPSYVAPESAEGRPQTSAVDVYGAGILLYELVTGRPPFDGGSALEVLRRHLDEEPRRPDLVPDPLWTVIERCLRKTPEERPSATNLARALRAVATGIRSDATAEQARAALGVAALLAPDPSPATVPDTGTPATTGDDDTTVLTPPGQSDPNAATSVLPQTGRPTPPGASDPTRAMPVSGDGTPQFPDAPGQDPQHGQPPSQPPEPEGPHPWQSQLRAARDRNEQTTVQPLDPSLDPLRRRPTRRPQQAQQPQQPPAQPYGAQPYGQQPPPPQQQYAPQPQQYAPQPQRRPEPPPQRYEPQRPADPEPRARREPRPRNPNRMRIPGLGCLKGCLFVVVILVVAGFLVWNFTDLPQWVAEGKSFWQTTKDWFRDIGDLLGKIPV